MKKVPAKTIIAAGIALCGLSRVSLPLGAAEIPFRHVVIDPRAGTSNRPAVIASSFRGATQRRLGSRRVTDTTEGQPVKYHPRGQKMCDLLGESKGKLDAVRQRALLSDQSICAGEATNEPRQVRTIDAMLFDTTTRSAGDARTHWFATVEAVRVRESGMRTFVCIASSSLPSSC